MPESARSPALEKIQEEVEKGGLELQLADLQRLALRLVTNGIDEGFIPYAFERAKRTAKVKNVGGFAKKALLEYDDWIVEYKKAPKPAPASTVTIPMLKTCPLCGKPIAAGKCNNVIGWAQCEDCGELYWDKSLKSWELEDIPQGQAG
jgi:hypothetical protein